MKKSVIVVCLILIAGFFQSSRHIIKVRGLRGKLFPSIMVQDMSGQAVDIKSLSPGKTKIISFWATWCPPCKAELTAYNSNIQRWQQDYNAELIGVSVDKDRSLASIKHFATNMGWNFKVLFDKDDKASPAFDIQAIPFLVIVDKDGIIVDYHSGYERDQEKLEKKLASLK